LKPDELLQLWREMASADAGVGGLDRRRLDPGAAVDLFACVFWPAGRPGLLIEGAGEQKPLRGRIPRCRGVKVIHEVIGGGAGSRTVLRVLLEDMRLLDIFAVLSADLVEVTRSETSAASALRRCIDRLSMWQGLFERLPAEGLSDEAQRGLFGELFVLADFFLPALDPLATVTAWVGSEPRNQDFVHGGFAVEVKTSLAKRHARLMISNEKQLDERPHDTLLLAHVRIDESEKGLTLPAMVERCRGLVAADPVASRELDDRLLAGGYLDLHAPLYLDHSWRVAGVRFFRVQGDFPRLTEANLPPGVGDISYSIIADDLGAHEVTRDAAVALIGGNA
jgi:hypothetical protein